MNVPSRYIFTFLLPVVFVAAAWGQDAPQPAAARDRHAVDIVSAGNELYRQGDYEAALQAYQDETLGQNPAAEVLYNRANCYYQMGDYDRAMELYRQAGAETYDDHLAASSRFNLGNSQLRKVTEGGQAEPKEALQGLAEAARYYRDAMEIEPDIPGGENNIALVRDMMQQIIEQMQQQDQDQQENQQEQQQGGEGQQDHQSQQDQQQSENSQQQQQSEQQQNEQSGQQDQQQSEGDQQQQSDQQRQQSEGDQEQQPEQQPASAGDQEENDQQRHEQSGITASQVLDRERERQQQQRARASRDRSVERDW